MAKKERVAPESAEMQDEVLEGELESATEQSDVAGEGVGGGDLTLLLEDARTKADEHWNQLLLAKAETENVRRRAKQDTENAHKFALEKFALELLPVKDSLEMGLAAAESTDDKVLANLKEGTALTLKMLTSAMEKFGIEALNPMGDSFDPALHQAMTLQESADFKPNTVMAVMQKGYLLNDRLIRPAMVVVSKAASADDSKHIDEQA
jgi:molecular chaperone GrpE